LMLGMKLSGVALGQAPELEHEPGAIWCAEAKLTTNGKAAIYWRNVAANPKGAVDRITNIDSDLTVVTVKDPTATAVAKDLAPASPIVKVYEVFTIRQGTIFLEGFCDDRPSLDAIGKILALNRPVAKINKADKSTTIFHDPAAKPESPGGMKP
jgi:hypothetical protein